MTGLAKLKLHVVKRIMKRFAGARWKKADSRPPKTVQPDAVVMRADFCRLYVALHEAGAHFAYADEYSTQTTVQSKYAWSTPHEQRFLLHQPKAQSVSSMVAVTRREVVTHWAFRGTTDRKMAGDFLQEYEEEIAAIGAEDEELSILLWDGAGYHTANSTKQRAKRLGVRVLINAAYCPELNPAERYI